MEKNNKKRLLALIEILRRYSNEEKHLKLSEIISYLEQKDISVNNRKTLYDDFKTLNECDINVEHDNDGYYLLDAPFNLSEIKIIQDSIYSLKNLDTNLLNKLSNKLYTFISEDEEVFLESLKYTNKHKDKKLLQRMEDVLLAIKNHNMITVTRDKQKDDIYPIFIHRSNDYYYFYYHYENSNKIYHFRFDNINDVKIHDDIVDNIILSKKDILKTIDESSNSFSKHDSTEVSFKILNKTKNIEDRILNDFPNAILTKDGFSVIVSINNIFFSKVLAYGKDIKIINKEVGKKYKDYLKDIASIYRQND